MLNIYLNTFVFSLLETTTYDKNQFLSMLFAYAVFGL